MNFKIDENLPPDVANLRLDSSNGVTLVPKLSLGTWPSCPEALTLVPKLSLGTRASCADYKIP
jgi:hypothetical protein